MIEPSILREYDIRGVVGETLAPEVALSLGRAFGSVVRRNGGKSVCVGYDGRLSSPALEAALVDGLRAAGIDVWRIGLGPTPMLYFAAVELATDGAIMVTGSHNPPDHNGFKLVLGGAPFFGSAIQELGRLATLEGKAAADSPGNAVERSVLSLYLGRLIDGLRESGDLGRPLKIAWDAGNGAAGDILSRLVAKLPGLHILLNQEIDGSFPAHHPDPAIEANLRQLQAAVVDNRCDLGIAFDGDGDRIGVVDDRGQILWPDQLMILFARNVLLRNPGATIIADVKSSQLLFDEISRAGGRPLMWRTGHSLIKTKMIETQSPLAGEMSGHVFFGGPYHGYDDALYAAVRLVGILSQELEPLSAIRRAWSTVVNTPECRIHSTDAEKFSVIEDVKRYLQKQGETIIEIDGVRVQTDDGWWLLRASNTQAMLIARCEASSSAGLERLKYLVNQALAAVNHTLVNWESS